MGVEMMISSKQGTLEAAKPVIKGSLLKAR